MTEVKEPITVEDAERLFRIWRDRANKNNLAPWMFGWMQSNLSSPDPFKRDAAQYFFTVIRDNFLK